MGENKMNCELWITIHSVLIALVAGASLYSAKSQGKRESAIRENLCALSVIMTKLKGKNNELKKEIVELKKKGRKNERT